MLLRVRAGAESSNLAPPGRVGASLCSARRGCRGPGVTDLDEVLERFHLTGLEYGPGLANHGPMAADAIVALGHSALLTGWVDLYAPRLPPLEPGQAIEAGERDAAVGDVSRMSDWVASFERDLAEGDWRDVLQRELSWLAPGFFASATHGWLRVAHAVRALLREETAVRRRELAFGLGLWAARFQRLPGTPGARAAVTPIEALMALEPVAPELRRPGLFFDAVRVLDDDSAFRECVESIDLTKAPVGETIRTLCCAGASLYLANPQSRVGYAHAVTATSALRLVEPVVDEACLRELLGHAVQSAFALHAVLSEARGDASSSPDAPEPSEEVRRMAEHPEEIRYRAACSLREHAIKLAEACLREDAIAPDPLLRLAAADAAVELEGARSWGDQA